MGCKHKNKLSLYARDTNWISTKKLCGNMIYVCKDCGAILEEKPVLKDTQTINNANNTHPTLNSLDDGEVGGLGESPKPSHKIKFVFGQSGNRYWIKQGGCCSFNYGFKSKAQFEEWFKDMLERNRLDWRAGYAWKFIGSQECVLIKSNGDEVK